MDIIKQIWPILSGLIIGACFTSFLKEKWKNKALMQDISKITKMQEEIKSEFQFAMESHKSELNRVSKEFELYATKKYEYYPELFKNIELYYEKVQKLSESQMEFDIDSFSKKDIERFMSDKQFSESAKEVILSGWNEDRKLSVIRVEAELFRVNYNEANKYFEKAQNFNLLHRLFFSEEIYVKAHNLILQINILWLKYNPELMKMGDKKFRDRLFKDTLNATAFIDEERDKLFLMLKSELETLREKR